MCYYYDSLNRLIRRCIIGLDTGSMLFEENYSYDVAGNITDAPDSCFTYDNNNRLTVFNCNLISYDLDGNMISNETTAFEYDIANRLTQAGSHTYTYNADNIRIRNLCSDEDTTYIYNTNCKLSQLLTKTTNGIITKYVYGNGLIGEEKQGEFKTYHFDYRGSTVAITNINGGITDTFKYDSYGKLTSRTGNSVIIFGYNGRDGVVTDKNGLIYMRARYYSPEMRRFINADILHGEISDSTSLNRYSYVNGNPVSFVDPFGLAVFPVVPNQLLIHYELETDIDDAINSAKEIGKRAIISDESISISMLTEEDEIERITNILGIEITCDIIAQYACDKFLDENGREFMLSDKCVSKEILDHIEAYNWSVGKSFSPNYLATGFSLKRKLDKFGNGNFKEATSLYDADSVYEATKSIDMRESDIVKVNGVARYSSQAFLFNYKDGLRSEYIGTKSDPWANERK